MAKPILYLAVRIFSGAYVSHLEVIITLTFVFALFVHRGYELGIPASPHLLFACVAVVALFYVLLAMMHDVRDRIVRPSLLLFYIVSLAGFIYFIVWPSHHVWGFLMPSYREACQELRAEFDELSYDRGDYRGWPSPEHMRKFGLFQRLQSECSIFIDTSGVRFR